VVAGQFQGAREEAVVREQQQPFGVEVQATDGNEVGWQSHHCGGRHAGRRVRGSVGASRALRVMVHCGRETTRAERFAAVRVQCENMASYMRAG
jgi:hypothetical protein